MVFKINWFELIFLVAKIRFSAKTEPIFIAIFLKKIVKKWNAVSAKFRTFASNYNLPKYVISRR